MSLPRVIGGSNEIEIVMLYITIIIKLIDPHSRGVVRFFLICFVAKKKITHYYLMTISGNLQIVESDYFENCQIQISTRNTTKLIMLFKI